MSQDSQFAICTICQAVYVVVPIIEETGQPRITPQGDMAFYLNPIKPGLPQFAKEVEPEVRQKADLSELLEKIKKSTSPTDLLA